MSTEIAAVAQIEDVAPGIVRVAAASAIAVNVALPLIELWRVAVVAPAPVVRYAVVATVATIALHLRHVTFGLRNERPASNAWTLAGLAAANLAAAVLVGRVWALQFASLAVSILIVVGGPAALALVSAVALAPLLLARRIQQRGTVARCVCETRQDSAACVPRPFHCGVTAAPRRQGIATGSTSINPRLIAAATASSCVRTYIFGNRAISRSSKSLTASRSAAILEMDLRSANNFSADAFGWRDLQRSRPSKQ